MVTIPTNTTGWSELMDGNLVAASYTMFDTAFGGMGFLVVMLFVVYNVMLYAKTRNLFLMFIVGTMFTSLYGLSIYVEETSLQILFLILVFEVGGIFYMILFNNK